MTIEKLHKVFQVAFIVCCVLLITALLIRDFLNLKGN